MNIFFLHERPEIAAQMLCDKHVVKMLLECCQMLWAAWHLTGFDNWSETVPTTIKVYKLTHAKHPTCMWVRRRLENYRWTAVHAQAIDREYTRRYGKVHACSKMAKWFVANAPLCNDCDPFPPATVLARREVPRGTSAPPICITNRDLILNTSLVKSYRNYYLKEKASFAVWKLGNVPYWYK